jgi:hypothetical protein
MMNEMRKNALAYLRRSSKERAARMRGRFGTSFTVEVSDSEGSARGEEGEMTLDRYSSRLPVERF